MTIQNIPLNQLTPSKANVGKTQRLTGIEELAANIKALGLLQNLQVRETDTGKYEVVAGRRRLSALKLLAKQKAIAKDADIPCQVMEGDNAAEVSLAENIMRLPMHPADQYEAFKVLADQGKGPEDIAARFGCAPSTVRQRLKLANVSPALLSAYRDDEMNLDQLMAFTVSDDHGQQEKVWEELPRWNRDPETIRRSLTAALVEADDAKAVFVGMDAYVAAGGAVLRDLFTPEHDGYLTDAALLDRLVRQKLEAEAETIRAEGWKWVDIMPDIDQSALRAYGRVYSVQEPLDAERQAQVDRLTAERDALAQQCGDEPDERQAGDIDALDEQIEALTEDTWRFVPEDIAIAGCVVGIGYDGTLDVVYGLVRPEDRPADEPAALHASGGKTAKPKDPSTLPAPLVQDLTAQRTAALRAMLTDNSDVALASVVHALALPVFYGPLSGESCLELRLQSASLSGTDDSRAAAKLTERHDALTRQLPEDAGALWDWLVAQERTTVLEVLAYCAACSVNGVVKPHERSDGRVAHADRLAVALNLNMTDWWQPTGESYLARVSKARILEAVTEGISASAAENFLKLKKDALVKHAEERLAGTGWLPALLRSPVMAEPEPEAETLAA
jgi:ParB family chromosome partitioning protein